MRFPWTQSFNPIERNWSIKTVAIKAAIVQRLVTKMSSRRCPRGSAKREVRATKFGREWTIQSKLCGNGTWDYHRPPSAHDLRALLDLLERKYQRRRASHEDVKQVAALLRRAEADERAAS